MVGQYCANHGDPWRDRINSAHLWAAHPDGIQSMSMMSPSTLALFGIWRFLPSSSPSPRISHQRSQKFATLIVLAWALMYLPKCPVAYLASFMYLATVLSPSFLGDPSNF